MMARQCRKGLVALVLSVILALSPISWAAASESQHTFYDSSQIKAIQDQYLYLEPLLEDIFTSPKGIGYWTQIETNRDNKAAIWSIGFASKVLGVEPDEQMYSEILANLCALLQGSIEGGISQQQELSNVKDTGDVGLDVLDIAASFAGDNASSDSLSMIIDTALDGKEVLIDSFGEAQYYQEALMDYSSTAALLNAISKYCDNDLLSDVANRIQKANESLLSARLEYLANTTEDLAEYDAKFFRDNLAFSLIRESDTYKTDDVVKWYVDGADNIISKFSTLKNAAEFSFRSVIAIGDLAFGTTNTFLHYQEMTALADTANALVKAIADSPRADGDPNEQTLTAINERCSLYRSLIAVHARGEYSLYRMLTSDAGLLGILSQPDGGSTDEWYEGQIEVMTRYANSIERLLAKVPEADSGNNEVAIPKGIRYKYENNGYYAYFQIDKEGNASLQYYVPGVYATAEDFYFSWDDGKTSYELMGERSKYDFDVTFSPSDETHLEIAVVCKQPYFAWEGMREGDTVWSDAVFVVDEEDSSLDKTDSTYTDLSGYIGTPVNSLVESLPDMSDEGVTVGVGFTNGSIIVEGPSAEGAIYYIGIVSDCAYSLSGIHFGMALDEACSAAEDGGGTLAKHVNNSDGSEYLQYSIVNNLSLSFYGTENVESVSLMSPM